MKHIKTVNKANLSATAKKVDVVSVRHLVSLHARLLAPLAIRNVQTKRINSSIVPE